MNTATNPRTGDTAGTGRTRAGRRATRRRTGSPGHSPAGTESAGGTSAAGVGTAGAVRAGTGPAERPPTRRRGRRAAVPGPPLPAADGCSTAWSARARRPSPPEGCPPPAGSGRRSWPPSTTATCSPGSGRLPPKQAPLPTTAQHGTGTRTRHRDAAVHRPRHRRHHPQNRLRRRHHPRRPRRRGPDPGHRPGLPRLPAPHPQGHHGPGPGLRLPAMHHSGALVRGPPHHLLVPRRNHRNRQRNPALLPSPPRDPQGTLEHPDAHRHPLVHPATPPRPRPDTPPEQLLPPGVTPWPPRDRGPDGRGPCGRRQRPAGRPRRVTRTAARTR